MGSVPEGTRDRAVYALGVVLGMCAGMLDVRIGDLLLTALLVMASTMLLGALRPRKPWRWVLLVAACVPLMHLAAYLARAQMTDRAHVYESFLGFVTGIAGAYGGAAGRRLVNELFK
jgi:hypothetical protein